MTVIHKRTGVVHAARLTAGVPWTSCGKWAKRLTFAAAVGCPVTCAKCRRAAL